MEVGATVDPVTAAWPEAGGAAATPLPGTWRRALPGCGCSCPVPSSALRGSGSDGAEQP